MDRDIHRFIAVRAKPAFLHFFQQAALPVTLNTSVDPVPQFSIPLGNGNGKPFIGQGKIYIDDIFIGFDISQCPSHPADGIIGSSALQRRYGIVGGIKQKQLRGWIIVRDVVRAYGSHHGADSGHRQRLGHLLAGHGNTYGSFPALIPIRPHQNTRFSGQIGVGKQDQLAPLRRLVECGQNNIAFPRLQRGQQGGKCYALDLHIHIQRIGQPDPKLHIEAHQFAARTHIGKWLRLPIGHDPQRSFRRFRRRQLRHGVLCGFQPASFHLSQRPAFGHRRKCRIDLFAQLRILQAQARAEFDWFAHHRIHDGRLRIVQRVILQVHFGIRKSIKLPGAHSRTAVRKGGDINKGRVWQGFPDRKIRRGARGYANPYFRCI